MLTVSPAAGNMNTEFVLNASACYDSEDPVSELQVRSDIGYNGSWDIDWTDAKLATWQFNAPGDYTIRMQVRDSRMYLSDCFANCTVIDEVPFASFEVTPAVNAPGMPFTFDASSSSDLETGPAAIEVRWDWDNDGNWDTYWSTDKTATHQYSDPGVYTVVLQVRDSTGQLDNCTLEVIVSAAISEFHGAIAPGAAMLVALLVLIERRRRLKSQG